MPLALLSSGLIPHCSSPRFLLLHPLQPECELSREQIQKRGVPGGQACFLGPKNTPIFSATEQNIAKVERREAGPQDSAFNYAVKAS